MKSLTIEEIGKQLDGLVAGLARGSHADLEIQARELVEPLERLREAARSHRVPHAATAEFLRIRAKIRMIREMLIHAEQVRLGVTGILGLVYAGHTGAQYSARGTPMLPSVPRWVAEG